MPPHSTPRRSLLDAGAAARMLGAACVLTLLWLAVWWAMGAPT